MPIHVLPDEVASQIAAGEVIERPASVIKELVENALDAGADQIDIHLRGSGQPFIEIRDNGKGISAKELPLAVTRHATSKLTSAEDLFRIQTLGFRGEALASIGSVSIMAVQSACKGDAIGAEIIVEGGKNQLPKPKVMNSGTTVKVENLFHNVPARLKFLKKDATERQNNENFILKYAIAYPQIKFTFTQDGVDVLRTSGSGDRREAIAAAYGLDYARSMMDVAHDDGDYRIEGFASPISLTRSNRREMTFFVNGRWVQDPALSAALMQAYHTYLMVGRYPIAFLYLNLPPEEVDVNVHPAKAEVRFRSSDRVFSLLQRAVKKAILMHSPVPEIPSNSVWQGPVSDITDGITQAEESEIIATDCEPTHETLFATNTINPVLSHFPLLRLVGQVGATYLVAEGPDGLYLIDQHAAHERVLFEKYQRAAGGDIPSQVLLEPVLVHFNPVQASLLNSELETINQLGFQVELFGSSSFLIRSIPAMFSNLSPEAAVRVLVEDFEENENPMQAETEARLIARICKKAAIKGGQVLSLQEQTQLLTELENCTSPRTCPHGRPTMIHLSVDLLERQFGRRGAR